LADEPATAHRLLERLAEHCLARGITLPGMRKVYTGGAPVFPRLLRAWQRLAPAAQIDAVYGSTEAEPMAHIALDEMREDDAAAMAAGRGLLVGRPVPEIALRIMAFAWGEPVGPFTRDEFAARCLPADAPGEIVVSGEHVLPGYLHGDGDAETKFRVDGVPWHRTGDAGCLDADGRLWLLGRCAARIADAHGILYPFTVECAIADGPGVRRSAVVAHRGRRLLVIEPRPGTRPDIRALAETLAWAQLDDILLLPRLPVDARHNAKIDYPALLARLARHKS
ncbi:MAG TPA: AMP-binding protein, partial [Armatimonadota bacterium]|nr:AMP-binding protein [Armatimonadota bacterium]